MYKAVTSAHCKWLVPLPGEPAFQRASAQVPQVFFNREHLGNAGSCSVFSQCGELKRRLLHLAAMPHDGLPAPEATLTKVDADVAFSSQPTSAQLSSLAKFGFKSVVCLSHSDELGALPVESAIAASTGLQYIRCPPCVPALVSTSHVEVDLIPNIKCAPEQCTPAHCALELQVALPPAHASAALPSALPAHSVLDGTGVPLAGPSTTQRSSTDNKPLSSSVTCDDGSRGMHRSSSLPASSGGGPSSAASSQGGDTPSNESSFRSSASSGFTSEVVGGQYGLPPLVDAARTPSPSGSAALEGGLEGGLEGQDTLGPLVGGDGEMDDVGIASPAALVGRRGSWGESPAMGSVASGLTGLSGDVWSLDALDLQGREPDNDAWTAKWLQGAIAAVQRAPKPVLVHDTVGVAAAAVTLTRAAQQLKAGFGQVLSWGRTLGHDIQEHADLSRAVQEVLDPAAGAAIQAQEAPPCSADTEITKNAGQKAPETAPVVALPAASHAAVPPGGGLPAINEISRRASS